MFAAEMFREAMPGVVRTFPWGHVNRVWHDQGPFWEVDIEGAPTQKVFVREIEGSAYVTWVFTD